MCQKPRLYLTSISADPMSLFASRTITVTTGSRRTFPPLKSWRVLPVTQAWHVPLRTPALDGRSALLKLDPCASDQAYGAVPPSAVKVNGAMVPRTESVMSTVGSLVIRGPAIPPTVTVAVPWQWVLQFCGVAVLRPCGCPVLRRFGCAPLPRCGPARRSPPLPPAHARGLRWRRVTVPFTRRRAPRGNRRTAACVRHTHFSAEPLP